MISFHKGNIFDAQVEAYVNTVNTVGVMGKGVALECKTRYPEVFQIYKTECNNKRFNIGDILTVRAYKDNNPIFILNFPTKQHWKNPSKLEWISMTLPNLKKTIERYTIKSIAIPPLGCGNGGLDWNMVKPLIINTLQDLDTDIRIYEP